MIDITDKSHKPDIAEIREYISNDLFTDICRYMDEKHSALSSVEYSGDKVLLGWNVRFHKSGRTLCRIYPQIGYFKALIVVGRKEKEPVEALLPDMSPAMREAYASTPEGMGQRWIVIDVRQDDGLYRDLLRIADIRRGTPAQKKGSRL